MKHTSMQRDLLTLWPLLLVITVFMLPTYAQSSLSPAKKGESGNDQSASGGAYALQKGMNEFGVWAGGSFHSPTLIGTATDRKYFTVGLRYGRVLAASKRAALEYTIDAIPVAIVFQPDFAKAISRSGASSVYGVGLSPIGFKLNLNRGRRVQPFLGTSGGFLYFKEPVPENIANGTRFNFAFDFGGGLQIFTSSRRAVMFGYKFHHISNGGRSQINPGLDSNIIFVGYSIFK